MGTEQEVIAVQTAWAGAIKNISKVFKNKGDYVQAAADAAGELYAYGKGNVLFKPTKAREYTFRPTAEEAMSYFVGEGAVENGYKEDGGFAINGGKVRIFLHHSSVPYSAAPAPVTEKEVIAVQTAWAGAIKNISKVYKDKGDYVQ